MRAPRRLARRGVRGADRAGRRRTGLPYERPPLSKGYLTGETARGRVYLHEEIFYSDHDIDLRTGTRVQALDLMSSEVELEAGERLRFDRLLLATGAFPRRLQGSRR